MLYRSILYRSFLSQLETDGSSRWRSDTADRTSAAKTARIERAILEGTEELMPRKIRELIAELENAGFENRGGEGSHRNFAHPKVPNLVTISGKLGEDAKKYQERILKYAVEESQK